MSDTRQECFKQLSSRRHKESEYTKTSAHRGVHSKKADHSTQIKDPNQQREERNQQYCNNIY
jgi:hypothetical protein